MKYLTVFGACALFLSGASTFDLEAREIHMRGVFDSPNEIFTTNETDKRWPDGRVPFQLSDNLDRDLRDTILDVMEKYHEHTCIRFEERKNESNYILIQESAIVSNSSVGVMGGLQIVNLKRSGIHREGTVIHELMHNLGFHHEQARPDRDLFVTINFDNIEKDAIELNFPKFRFDEASTVTLYDYSSILHYGTKGFAIDKSKDTILPIRDDITVGQRIGFSQLDILKILRYYHCPVKYFRKLRKYSLAPAWNPPIRRKESTPVADDEVLEGIKFNRTKATCPGGIMKVMYGLDKEKCEKYCRKETNCYGFGVVKGKRHNIMCILKDVQCSSKERLDDFKFYRRETEKEKSGYFCFVNQTPFCSDNTLSSFYGSHHECTQSCAFNTICTGVVYSASTNRCDIQYLSTCAKGETSTKKKYYKKIPKVLYSSELSPENFVRYEDRCFGTEGDVTLTDVDENHCKIACSRYQHCAGYSYNKKQTRTCVLMKRLCLRNEDHFKFYQKECPSNLRHEKPLYYPAGPCTLENLNAKCREGCCENDEMETMDCDIPC